MGGNKLLLKHHFSRHVFCTSNKDQQQIITANPMWVDEYQLSQFLNPFPHEHIVKNDRFH
jgi:hypothetical protein